MASELCYFVPTQKHEGSTDGNQQLSFLKKTTVIVQTFILPNR